jgi:hypothetical protein
MITCLKYLVPISCFLFLGSSVWSLVFPGRTAFQMQSGLGERTVQVQPERADEASAVRTSEVTIALEDGGQR